MDISYLGCCTDISLMDEITHSPDSLSRQEPKRQEKKQTKKKNTSYFEHPARQRERRFILTALIVLFSEGSWLLRKPCKPHWNSIEVQSGSDTSNIPMNDRTPWNSTSRPLLTQGLPARFRPAWVDGMCLNHTEGGMRGSKASELFLDSNLNVFRNVYLGFI